MERTPTFEAAAWKRTAETHDYRQVLAQALIMAKNYDGSEARYEGLTGQLIELENITKESPSLQKENPHNREIAAALQFTPTRPRDIQEVLDVAIAAKNKALHRSLFFPENEIDEAKDQVEIEQMEKVSKARETKVLPPIFVLQIRGVLLPTDSRPLSEAGVYPQAFEPARFEKRFQDVFAILESINVYADDVIVMIGETKSKMMREVSYAAVRIPRLERSILVCDQVGEATFVIRGDVSAEELLHLTKSDLQETFGSRIRKVVRREEDQWKQELCDLLDSNSAWGDSNTASTPHKLKEKVDVREFYRNQVAETFKARFTPEQWLKLNQKERVKKIHIDGKGLRAIAGLFDIGDPIRFRINNLLLAAKIYGASDQTISPVLETAQTEEKKRLDLLDVSKRTPEEWTECLKDLYSAEQWIKLSSDEREKVRVDGKSLHTIGRVCGIGDPVGHSLNHLLLGQKIYGADDPIIKSALDAALEESVLNAELAKRTLEEWVTRIKDKYTAHEWTALDSRERHKILQVDGRGLKALAKVFEIENTEHTTGYLLLGQKIYGADDPIIKSALEKAQAEEEKRLTKPDVSKRTPEEWIRRVAEEYTAEQWIKLNVVERQKIQIDGKGLFAIAGLFGIENPYILTLNHLLLGAKIYGENNPVIKPALEAERAAVAANVELFKRTPEEWVKRIKEKYTAEQWISLAERRKIQVDGKGLTAIASVFGFTSPISNTFNHLFLGAKIYGEDDPVIKSALGAKRRGVAVDTKLSKCTLEEWTKRIKELYTVESWVALGSHERRKIQVDGRGLKALAKIFEIENPEYTMGYLLLGEKIYGTDNPVIRSALSIAREETILNIDLSKRTPEEWAKRIKEFYTSKHWVSLTQKNRQKIHVDGKGLKAIASMLGIGDPVNYSLNHLLLGAKIFGTDDQVIEEALAEIQKK